MYSESSSATHHIFFPPRLEVVVEQQDPDGFPPNVRHQLTFYRLLGHQTHGPSRTTFGRITTNHGNDPLFLAGVERDCGPRMPLIVERPLQAFVLIAPSDLAHSFGGQSDIGRHLGHSLTVMQLREDESAKDHPNGLNPTSKQQGQLVPVTLWQADVQSMVGS